MNIVDIMEIMKNIDHNEIRSMQDNDLFEFMFTCKGLFEAAFNEKVNRASHCGKDGEGS